MGSFIEAYRDLCKLREPAALPGWFRKIAFKHCDRQRRNKHFSGTSLDDAPDLASDEPGPAEAIAAQETREGILRAISALPEHERIVTTLYYIDGYSQKEVAGFLEVPVTTVKTRLYAEFRRIFDEKWQRIGPIYGELKYFPGW
jgi:RNA polymerase sigma factor (sigma-70 family)